MPCGECGFDYGSLSRGQIPGELRERAQQFVLALEGFDPDLEVRAKPAPDVWSPLEYACHMRDVLRVQRERIWLALVEVTPEFAPMRRDERAVEDHYNEQDPAIVATEIAAAADSLAEMFESLDDDGWARSGIYNYPEPTERTVEWIGVHTVHELMHHTADVSKGSGS